MLNHTTIPILAGLVAFLSTSAGIAQQASNALIGKSNGSDHAPLSIIQSNAIINIQKGSQNQSCVSLVTRINIRNQLDSTVRVGLIGASLSAVDDLGFDLIPHQTETFYGQEAKIGGIYTITGSQRDWAKDIEEHHSDFSLLRGDQELAILLQPTGFVYGGSATANCVPDADKAFYNGHRPTSMSLTGAIAIYYPDNQFEIQSFSLPDKPVKIAP